MDVRLLDSAGGGLVRVGVSVAEEWLNAPDRLFPVTIDPSWHFTTDDSGGVDTYVRSDNPDGAYGGSTELHAGSVSPGVVEWSLVRWPIAAESNSFVLEAHVNMYNHWSAGCGARSVNLYAADSPFDDATTWNTQPDPVLRADGSLMGAISPAFAYGAGECPAAWSPNMDTTEVARAWVDGEVPNYGMLITASESDTAGRKFFLSREDGQWGSAPALSVTYTDRPPVSQAVSPAAGAVLVTSTPTLVSTSVTDPDGPVKYWFRVATDPSGEANVVANSGWVSSPSWQVPDRVLNDGQTYYWRVWTMDTLGALRAPGWVQSLRVNMRLGIDSTQTYDTFGPVSVNQATGNLVTSDATQSMTAVGGQAGLSFSYNIKAPDQGGLTGKYYNYSGGFPPPSFTSEGPATVRTDSTLWFNWAPNPPAEGVSATSFMARWDGFFTAPVTGYYIGSGVAGGNKVWLNNVAVVNRWDQIQYWNTCAGPCWDNNASVHLNAGQQVPVVVQYYVNAGGMINVYYKVRDAAGGRQRDRPALCSRGRASQRRTTTPPPGLGSFRRHRRRAVLRVGTDLGGQHRARRCNRRNDGVSLERFGLGAARRRGRRGGRQERRRHRHVAGDRRQHLSVQRRRYSVQGLVGA